MPWHAAFAILCAMGAHAFAPAPIWWGGLPAKKFVLVPKALASGVPVPHKGMDTPQQLTIWDQASAMSSNDIPFFLANLDHTIAWGDTGMCVEASCDKSGDEIRINRCTGGPNQLWGVLPWDQGRKNVIKLKGSQLCIDVNAEGGWNGASVELRECNEKASGSWLFGEPVIRGGASQPAPFFRMRHATFGLMLVLGALSLSTWAWLWRKTAVRLPKDQRRAALNADHGGVSMLTFEGGKPLIPATLPISPISHEDREDSTAKEATNPMYNEDEASGLSENDEDLEFKASLNRLARAEKARRKKAKSHEEDGALKEGEVKLQKEKKKRMRKENLQSTLDARPPWARRKDADRRMREVRREIETEDFAIDEDMDQQITDDLSPLEPTDDMWAEVKKLWDSEEPENPSFPDVKASDPMYGEEEEASGLSENDDDLEFKASLNRLAKAKKARRKKAKSHEEYGALKEEEVKLQKEKKRMQKENLQSTLEARRKDADRRMREVVGDLVQEMEEKGAKDFAIDADRQQQITEDLSVLEPTNEMLSLRLSQEQTVDDMADFLEDAASLQARWKAEDDKLVSAELLKSEKEIETLAAEIHQAITSVSSSLLPALRLSEVSSNRPLQEAVAAVNAAFGIELQSLTIPAALVESEAGDLDKRRALELKLQYVCSLDKDALKAKLQASIENAIRDGNRNCEETMKLRAKLEDDLYHNVEVHAHALAQSDHQPVYHTVQLNGDNRADFMSWNVLEFPSISEDARYAASDSVRDGITPACDGWLQLVQAAREEGRLSEYSKREKREALMQAMSSQPVIEMHSKLILHEVHHALTERKVKAVLLQEVNESVQAQLLKQATESGWHAHFSQADADPKKCDAITGVISLEAFDETAEFECLVGSKPRYFAVVRQGPAWIVSCHVPVQQSGDVPFLVITKDQEEAPVPLHGYAAQATATLEQIAECFLTDGAKDDVLVAGGDFNADVQTLKDNLEERHLLSHVDLQAPQGPTLLNVEWPIDAIVSATPQEVAEPAVMILNVLKNRKKHNEITCLKNTDAYNDKINEATEQDKTIVVKFFAGYCRACKAMAPKFQRVADEWEDIEFYEVQLEANMALVKSLGIKTLPYVEFVLGKRGKVHGQAVGPSRVPEVPKWLAANVGTERRVHLT